MHDRTMTSRSAFTLDRHESPEDSGRRFFEHAMGLAMTGVYAAAAILIAAACVRFGLPMSRLARISAAGLDWCAAATLLGAILLTVLGLFQMVGKLGASVQRHFPGGRQDIEAVERYMSRSGKPGRTAVRQTI